MVKDTGMIALHNGRNFKDGKADKVAKFPRQMSQSTFHRAKSIEISPQTQSPDLRLT